MALRHLNTSPKEDDFTPVQEHQQQTPDTFFGGKPVLYARYANLTLSIPTSKLQKDSAIARFTAITSDQAAPEESLIEDVEVWVSSRCAQKNLFKTSFLTAITGILSYFSTRPLRPVSQSSTPKSPSMPQ
jgi:hypothetical protein